MRLQGDRGPLFCRSSSGTRAIPPGSPRPPPLAGIFQGKTQLVLFSNSYGFPSLVGSRPCFRVVPGAPLSSLISLSLSSFPLSLSNQLLGNTHKNLNVYITRFSFDFIRNAHFVQRRLIQCFKKKKKLQVKLLSVTSPGSPMSKTNKNNLVLYILIEE